jgi:hypothetical protein
MKKLIKVIVFKKIIRNLTLNFLNLLYRILTLNGVLLNAELMIRNQKYALGKKILLLLSLMMEIYIKLDLIRKMEVNVKLRVVRKYMMIVAKMNDLFFFFFI